MSGGSVASGLPPAEWTHTATAYPRQRTLAQLFEAQVDRTPSAIAVVHGERRMSYRQLERSANRLAVRLRQLGVSGGALVGLCAERSAEMIIGILGILKAGGAYVPLDRGYPRARLAVMLEDAAPMVLVTCGDVASCLPPYAGKVVRIEEPLPEGERLAAAASGDGEDPGGGAAYVIYTSGTTGRPKGVVATHRAVARLVLETNYVSVRSSDVFLALSPLSFDAATFEIWGALLHGARLVVHRSGARLDPREVVENLQREGVSILWLTAALFDELTLHQLAGLRGLRYLLAGGDVLPVAAIQRALRGLPETTLINGYGPTETTTFATAFRFPRDWSGASAPIGRPIANTEVHVLDEERRSRAIGEEGELYIGGDGLALGYLRQPELTAERFVPSPFDPAARLYRTGDRARWLPDGTIEFLGRRDQQVKLRGFRIELEEIENALTRDERVAQAVVVMREVTPGDKRLIAYVVASTAAPALEAERDSVRRRLAETLPEYMVPSSLVVLERLPVTINGKVDRAALPAGEWRAEAAEYAAPQTSTEQQLAALWSELLNVPQVGRDDDFFALGGHSLLAGRLAARIRAALQREMALAVIYREPTLRALAAYLDGARPRGAEIMPPAPPPLSAAALSGPAPLSFPQERVWFLERVVPGNLAYQMQATLSLCGPLDAAVLAATLNELVARHSILRSAFKEVDGAPVQEELPAVRFELPVVDLSGSSPEEFHQRAYERIRAETSRPFQLEQGRLARWVLFRHDAEHHLLLHAEHHLIHDGWSLAIFLDELQQIYTALRAGRSSTLPPPALQFADFARWQRRWMEGDVLAAFVAHWKQALTPTPAPLALPTDRARPPVFSFVGHALREDFSSAEYARLRSAAKAHDVTLFTVMFSGFALLLARYAQQGELVIGVGAANRRLAEAERLLGMMINTLPLRVDLRGDPTFAQLLAQVHRTAIDAYTWADVPLDRLVDALGLPRDPSRNPLFSTIFSFHDAAVPDLSFAGVEAQLRIEQNGSAKADINIIVIPRAEQRVGRAASREDDSLSIIWEYATDLFDEATMRQMLEDYRGLLADGLERPGVPVSELVLVTAMTTVATTGGGDGSEIELAAAALREAGIIRQGQPVLALGMGALEPAVVLAGGELVRLDEDLLDRDGHALSALLAKHPGAAAILPAACATALASRAPASLRGLTALLVIGDGLASAPLRKLARNGSLRLWLGAGANADDSPLALLAEAGQPLRPIAGVHCAIRDRHGAELPMGGLGPLELRRGASTASLTRWLARRTREGGVQLRGDVSELGELSGFVTDLHDVRAALASCEAVREAHVERRGGELLAWVVTDDEAAVRGELAASLPTYLQPSRLLLLPALPLGRDGRVDAATLPTDEAPRVEDLGARSPTQARVAALCAELLGLAEIELRASFFLLGGRSLLATRLVALVNRELGVELPVAVFLRQPTVFDLAAAVDRAKAAPPEAKDAVPQRSARRHAAELLAQLDQLSDAEVHDLLKEIG